MKERSTTIHTQYIAMNPVLTASIFLVCCGSRCRVMKLVAKFNFGMVIRGSGDERFNLCLVVQLFSALGGRTFTVLYLCIIETAIECDALDQRLCVSQRKQAVAVLRGSL